MSQQTAGASLPCAPSHSLSVPGCPWCEATGDARPCRAWIWLETLESDEDKLQRYARLGSAPSVRFVGSLLHDRRKPGVAMMDRRESMGRTYATWHMKICL